MKNRCWCFVHFEDNLLMSTSQYHRGTSWSVGTGRTFYVILVSGKQKNKLVMLRKVLGCLGLAGLRGNERTQNQNASSLVAERLTALPVRVTFACQKEAPVITIEDEVGRCVFDGFHVALCFLFIALSLKPNGSVPF